MRIVYYDDVPDEAAGIRGALQREVQDLAIETMPPPQALGQEDEQARGADLFLVDFALTHPAESAAPVGYVGTTLAAHLRALFPDVPLVVITKRDVLDHLKTEQRRQLGERLSCDEVMIKQEVLDNPQREVMRLVSLAEGFRVLKEEPPNSWDQVLVHLRVDQKSAEAGRLHESGPPIAREMTVSAIASWIRKVLMQFPGILYDDLHAATNLGLSVESFQSQPVQEMMAKAKYAGVFSADGFQGYWWKDRLRSAAIAMLEDAGHRGDVIPAFAETLRSKLGIVIESSRCIWDGSPGADRVCHLLQKPVKLEHTLSYSVDSRPAVMDQARVSFRAIRESEDFMEDLLDPIGRDLLQSIQDCPDPLTAGGSDR